MEELYQSDQPTERPTYNSAIIANWHQNGLLNRVEAEALDIIYTRFSQLQEDDIALEECERIEGQLEPSCVAIIHEGMVIPILDLEEITQRSRTRAEKIAVYTWVASVISDVLLAFLEEKEHGM